MPLAKKKMMRLAEGEACFFCFVLATISFGIYLVLSMRAPVLNGFFREIYNGTTYVVLHDIGCFKPTFLVPHLNVTIDVDIVSAHRRGLHGHSHYHAHDHGHGHSHGHDGSSPMHADIQSRTFRYASNRRAIFLLRSVSYSTIQLSDGSYINLPDKRIMLEESPLCTTAFNTSISICVRLDDEHLQSDRPALYIAFV